MILRVIVPWLSKKPRKKNKLRLWCLGFQKSNERELLVRVKASYRSHGREMLVKVMVSVLLRKPWKRKEKNY